MPPSDAALVTGLPAFDSAVRAIPYSTTRFDAFRVSNVGDKKRPVWRTYEVSIKGYLLPTVEAARDAALLGQAFAHKDQLIVRETGDQGVKLHIFSIKQRSQPSYVYEGHQRKRVQRFYADPLCTIDGGVIGGAL